VKSRASSQQATNNFKAPSPTSRRHVFPTGNCLACTVHIFRGPRSSFKPYSLSLPPNHNSSTAQQLLSCNRSITILRADLQTHSDIQSRSPHAMASSDSPLTRTTLSDSSVTIPSDSENYSANNELSPSPPSSSSSPLILYKPPTIWGLLRGAAINLLLPFVNGLMLGFGELFAHEAAFRLGWSGTKVGIIFLISTVYLVICGWLRCNNTDLIFN
jgi:Outer membrane protein TOM13